ncbi:hypothetical protein [Microbulbifer halophilus]|uniref:Uncharacterized protein n=1 Tax=Microbulbifer halophilus TaxID=453963 RepID=A0ABW5EIF5_9GAMM|nr:hypothetical protein [Microbulbifer halophilus]MCW8127685.1 hypothetical protein [Microbulbifer halophilus]
MDKFSDSDAELEFGAPRGWYSRGYVPHFDHYCALQSITFRLADSLPQAKLEQLGWELRQANLPESHKDLEKRKKNRAVAGCRLRLLRPGPSGSSTGRTGRIA